MSRDDSEKQFLIIHQGQSDFLEGVEEFDDKLKKLQEKIQEWLNLKNVNFLFGSGTSCNAISTMSGLFDSLKFEDSEKDLEETFYKLCPIEKKDLEQCLSVLYAARTYYDGIYEKLSPTKSKYEGNIKFYSTLIKKIESHIFNKIFQSAVDLL